MGQQINPNVIGAMAEGDLSARYANADNKRKLSLYEQSLKDSQANADRNYGLEVSKLGMAKDAQKAQEKQGMYSMLTAIPTAAMATYGLGKQFGWWGGDKKPNSIYTYIPPSETPYDYSSMNPEQSYSYDMDVFSPPGSYGENSGKGGSYISENKSSGDSWLGSVWDRFSKWLFPG
jgi:hypothetical protein